MKALISSVKEVFRRVYLESILKQKKEERKNERKESSK